MSPIRQRSRSTHHHGPPGRHLHLRLLRRRDKLLSAGGGAALLAVLGPGLLAGLSDDDPAGITTQDPELTSRLDPVLWNMVGHSPKALLKRIDEGTERWILPTALPDVAGARWRRAQDRMPVMVQRPHRPAELR